ncbi:MAG: flagellar hook-basal body complex protein FliE [Planctomycetota bacterium]|nr:flagellar hook-basal body complex protein FliE [Planctomycetota bacterium]
MQIRPDSLFARYESQLEKQRLSSRDSVGSEISSGLSSANASGAKATGGNFLELVSQGVGKVNEMQQTSTRDVERMLSGEDVESVEVYSGLQKADMAFRLLVQVRNKLMQAYEEINNIRV